MHQAPSLGLTVFVLQAWELKHERSFHQALRDREKDEFASSEAMVNVSALRASQKMILWTCVLSQQSA